MGGSFSRRLLVSVDAVGYGSGDDIRQRSMQTAIPAVLADAAKRAGLDRTRWVEQQAGDGELAILPDDQSDHEPEVVDDFVRELNTALARHNRELRDDARLRLRLAVHNGVAAPADFGYAGQGVVAVSRLVDAAPVKAALRAVPTANLALVLSERVFLDVVAQGHTAVPPAAFRAITVHNKEFRETAYLHLPGHDVHGIPTDALDSPRPAPAPARTDPPPAADSARQPHQATMTQNFYGSVDATESVVGIQWNA
ncbi:hypothetical protein [Nocardia nova]|nr:hypothetical protein [Nocardia nova]